MVDLQNTVLNIHAKDMQDIIYCPLSKQIFSDPVIARDGYIYERQMIEECLKTTSISPITRAKISKTVSPVIFVKQLVEEFLAKNISFKDDQFEPVYNLYDVLVTKRYWTFEWIKKFPVISSEELMKVIDFYTADYKHVFWDKFYKNTEIMIYLIDHIDNLEYTDNSNWKLIHIVAFLSNDDVLNYIIEKGCMVNIVNNACLSSVFDYAVGNYLIKVPTIRKIYERTNIKHIKHSFAINSKRYTVDKFNIYPFTDLSDRINFILPHISSQTIIPLINCLLEKKEFDGVLKIINKYPERSIESFLNVLACGHPELIDRMFSIVNAFDLNSIEDDVIENELLQILPSDILFRLLSLFKSDKLLLRIFNMCITEKKYDILNDIMSTKYINFIADNWDTFACELLFTNCDKLLLKVLIFADVRKLPLDLINTSDGDTFLHKAIKQNNKILIKYLLDNGNINLTHINKDGLNLVHCTVLHSDLETLNILVRKGVSYNIIRPLEGNYPIHTAVRLNKLDMVIYFLSLGVDKNILTSSNETLLHVAAEYATVDMIKFLLNIGVNIDVVSHLDEKYYHKLPSNDKLGYETFIKNSFMQKI